LVVQDLGTAGGLTLDPGAGARLQRVVVGGAITRPRRQGKRPWVEGTCGGKRTLSKARGGVLSIVSGAAGAQTSRQTRKVSMEPGLQVEALENAVHGAHPNLLSFLAKQVATN